MITRRPSPWRLWSGCSSIRARLLFILLLSFSAATVADPVINEAMVNEPAGYQTLEWIELYYGPSQAVDLDAYSLTVDNVLVELPLGITINPHEYLVICRKLVATEGEASFEGVWGDSSGVWGDCEAERLIPEPIVASFKLKNDHGLIQLWDGVTLVSELAWDEAGADGVSLERMSHHSDSVAPSIDAGGCTPGVLNSLTPVSHDLALTDAQATVASGLTTITITITNRGLWSSDSVTGQLFYADDSTLLESFEVGALLSGDSIVITLQYRFPDLRTQLLVRLPDDDRPSDNTLLFYAPGEDYPPVLLSEIMASPSDDPDNEWVEIQNVSTKAIDISEWLIGDPIKQCLIGDSQVMIEPGQRLVLVADQALFQMTYYWFGDDLIQPLCWAKLNNDGDTVRLIDPCGLEADCFGYDRIASGTYCRGEGEYQNQWGPSEEETGSPGAVNSVVFSNAGSPVSLAIEPGVFSPDGDGYEDSVVIHLESPDMDRFELKIYDRQGRLVEAFNTTQARSNSYTWRGGTDRGGRLPIGLYVVYFEVPGVGSAKEAVVIAR